MDLRKYAPIVKGVISVILVWIIYTFIPDYLPSWKESGIAAMLTVLGVLDQTIGATINKCVNTIVASIIGGSIGYGVFLIGGKLGSTGQIAYLVSLVIMVLLFGLILKYTNVVSDQYDGGLIGLVTAITTAALSTMSAHGLMNQLTKTRLMGLATGISVCLMVSIVIPVFARGFVHRYMIEYLDKLATFYEGLAEVCSEKGELNSIESKEFIKSPVEVVDDKGKYKSMLINVTYEPHGRLFWFPCDQYAELGDICRVVAHQCCTLSYNLIDLSKDEAFGLQWKHDTLLKKACFEMSSQSAKSLRSLAETIRTKTNPSGPTKETLSAALNVASEFNAEVIETQISHILSPLIKSVGAVEKLIKSVDELARVTGYHEPVKPYPVREEISEEEEKADHVTIDIDSVPVSPIVQSQSIAIPPSQPISTLGPVNHVVTVPASQQERWEKDTKIDHVVIDMSELDPADSLPTPAKRKLLTHLFSRFKRLPAKIYPLNLNS